MTALATNHSAADPIRTHCEMLHGLAKGIDGVLVVSVYHATGSVGTVTQHRIGDVDGTVAAIEPHRGTQGANVYASLCVMRRDLPRGKRGKTSDILGVFGLVADQDSDTGNAGALPIEPNYIVETSPGNRQAA